MASTLTSIMSTTRAFDPNDAGLGQASSALGLDSAIDSKEALDELRQSVEAKSAKALARARWKKLRNVIHGLEFPKIHVNEDKLASLRLNAQKVKADSTHTVEVSREWLLQLQDFWSRPPAPPESFFKCAVVILTSHVAQGAILRGKAAHAGRARA